MFIFKVLNNNVLSVTADYKAHVGRSDLKFQYVHSANDSNRIDPSASNIIDMYLLTRNYDNNFRLWLLEQSQTKPLPPSSDQLFIEYGAELNKIKGVKVANPKGAFYCVAELPITDSDHFAQWILEKFNYNNETIMVAPASGFYSTPGEGKNQIRMAYVLNKKDLIKSVEILGEALKQYNS